MIEPLLSVCLITYNHRNFIREAIEGVLMQNVNFSWELIIADDFSTDGTREIVMEYKEKHPDFIKLIFQKQNVGAAKNWMELITTPKSKYIAYFDGDDYWTDPLKLQKQVDFLEANLDFSLCSGNALIKDENSGLNSEWLGSGHKSIYKLKDSLRYGSHGATCTLVFRSRAISEFPNWFLKLKGGDWPLQILCANYGKLMYFKEVTAVYRKHKGGISASANLQDTINVFENYGLETIKILKKQFTKRYSHLLSVHAAEYWHYNLMQLYIQNKNYRKARKSASIVLFNLFWFDRPLLIIKNAIKVIILSYK